MSDSENEIDTTKEVKEYSAESFEELGVCQELCIACEALGWKKPSSIQAASIPWALKGRDLIALAETGSGKTASFAIPIIQSLLDNPQRLYALVLAPTRELCVQICEQFQALGSAIALEVAVILGGIDMVSQAIALAKKPHIIVASPGRLVDHLETTKGFSLRSVKYLVLDEADRLLSMDFEDALNKIIDVLPYDRRTLLFSATMTTKLSKLQRAALKRPVKIQIANKYDTAKGLTQNILIVPHKYKLAYLVAVLKQYNNTQSSILFTNTCSLSQKLSIILHQLGFTAVSLHGKMTQPQRLGALNSFKAGNKKILICTEVGSRGLDIPNVDLVVNVDIPLCSKDYIHRVGRTARAGKQGNAVTLVTQYDIEAYQKIEHALGKKLDELQDFPSDVAMLYQEKVLEATRKAEMEYKDGGKKKDDEEENGNEGAGKKRKNPRMMSNKSKMRKMGLSK